jgi:hypothetical protein
MNAVAIHPAGAPLPVHPNEFDRKRIERALKARRRYRYVKPRVLTTAGGYCILSPCCSRNIDPNGGEIDIALLHWDPARAVWRLMWKDHKAAAWALHSIHERLAPAIDLLSADPERLFWQ